MSKVGRPTVITPEVVSVLVTSLQDGMTVRQACWQSAISHEAYYSRLRSDEKFADIMTRSQDVISMKARRVIIEAINAGNVNASKWWLEKKAPEEFGRNPNPILQHMEIPERERLSEEEVFQLKQEMVAMVQGRNKDDIFIDYTTEA